MGDSFSNISGGVGGVNIANDGSTINVGSRAPADASHRARVFICHASPDKPYATQLKAQLEAAGHAVWLDASALVGGDDWPQVIARAIAQSDAVTVLVSDHLVATRGFAKREIELAMAPSASAPRGATVIPLLLGDVTLPRGLSHLHAIDLRTADAIDQLLDALARCRWGVDPPRNPPR